jgi:3-hydroxyacyl-[acyl-carrier-protein] dehydratase
MRWTLLDEILEIQKGVRVRSRSHVPAGEINQEPLLLEMMAQTGGILMGAEKEFKDDVVFAKIETASFPIKGSAGEPLEIIAEAEHLRPEGSWIQAEVRNSRGTIAAAKLMLVNAGSLVPGKETSTTFHETFMKHYKVWDKIK